MVRARLDWYERVSGERVTAAQWIGCLAEHRLTRRSRMGRHVAPYLAPDGSGIALEIGPRGALESESVRGGQGCRVLPRGYHLAPYTIEGDAVLLAIDAEGRCVARLRRREGESPVGIIRDLMLILDAHEAMTSPQPSEVESSGHPWDDCDDEDEWLPGDEWKQG